MSDIVIRHTHLDGTLLEGTVKGDGIYELIGPRTVCGFKYFRSIQMIGLPQSRDRLAKRWQINKAAELIRAAGHSVIVEIDDTPREVSEVKADRADRLDARYDALAGKAQRLGSEAERRFAAADHYAQRFAGGQPILVGHYSERGARTAQKRIDQNMHAGVAAQREAETVADRASVVGVEAARRERPDVIIRRIDRLEAELRQTMHRINGTRPANDWRGAYAPELGHKPADGAWLEQCEARREFIEHQLAAERAALAEHVANGYVMHSRDTVHKGDTVAFGSRPQDRATVTRTNPKTVTLNRTSYPRTLPYEGIVSVECPHDGTVTEQQQRAPLPRRPKPAVATEVPEVAKPVEVSAGTECFVTPPAVIARMIEVAELAPGMNVLEPSAGTGAIVRAVAKLGCHVWAVEQDPKLAELLGELPCLPRSAVCADFMTCEPRDMADRYGWPRFDRVMMNPPFSAEVRHVLRAHRFLRSGGRLVAVMSAGVRFSARRADFREFVTLRGGTITDLPADAFTPATGVSAVLVTINAEVTT